MTLDALTFLKLLAHNLRWEIVQALASSDHRVHELVAQLDEPMNLVSYHLRQLREAGIVRSRRSNADGRDVYYSLDLTRTQQLYQQVGQAIHPALVREQPPQSDIPTQRVLFLCTHNSARSQMAEGFLRALGSHYFEAYSAGSHPTIVRPEAIRTMDAFGLDIRGQASTHLSEYTGQQFDYVITVCDQVREVCPTFDGGTVQYHWGYPDPNIHQDPYARQTAYQQVANQIRARIQYFVDGNT